MYRRTILLLFVLLSAPIVSFAASSRISDVTVYGDRAQVTRTQDVAVQEGEVELIFGGLPASLDDQSVQVWGSGSAKATLEGVTVDLEPPPEAPDGKIAELTARIEKLRDDKNLLLEKKKALGSAMQMLVDAKPEKIRSEDKIVWGNVAEIETIVVTLVNDLKNILAQYRTIDANVKRIDQEIAALEKELRKIKNPSGDRTKAVTVKLTVSRAGTLKLEFSYLTQGASWAPLYDVRALPDEGQVEITSFAEIIQRTGEDWSNISLSVSTAKPGISGTPPKLNPIYLTFYRPPPPPRPAIMYRAEDMPSATTAPAPMAPPPMEADGEADEYEETAAEVATASVNYAGASVFFEIKQRKDIPSDGESHRVPIAVDVMKADFDHSAWPEAKSLAYLRAKIKNTTGHPFVGGKANVFVGASFIGATQLDNWADAEEKKISLGIDQGIRIERKLVNKNENESGSKISVTYEYKIEVKNFKNKPVNIEIFDRIPISRQGDVEVKVEKITPEPSKREDNGITSWRLNLNPGATTEIRLSYTVRYPKDQPVVGLP